ncbi:MAG: DUF1131 domain-containing protein [Alphaproteobacteria bacterium]|nr:DUF1131 domain-containing protein [Alphaproteobacteria bacterium]
MLSRVALILVPLALLVACGPANTSAPTGSAGAVPAPAASPADRALALDEYAVGPIVAQTPFTVAAIQALFPKDQVALSDEVIMVTRDDVVMLEIRGERGLATVGEIRIAGRSGLGPRGEVLGMAWPKLDVPLKRCWMGRDDDLHAVICTQPGEPVLRYVFEVPGWKRNTMPPREVLASASLRGFIWKSGAGGYSPAGGATG